MFSVTIYKVYLLVWIYFLLSTLADMRIAWGVISHCEGDSVATQEQWTVFMHVFCCSSVSGLDRRSCENGFSNADS